MTAITGTITGTILVAYKATNNNNKEVKSENTKSFRKTVFIALGSSLAYAVLVVAGQAASEIHGQIHTLWMGRLVSILFLLLIFYIRQRTPAIPIRWWPLLCVQGLLDTSGYIALFAGSFGPGKEIATVVAATFGGITVLLARIFLKENINTIQCSGIVLILGGVLVLSSQ